MKKTHRKIIAIRAAAYRKAASSARGLNKRFYGHGPFLCNVIPVTPKIRRQLNSRFPMTTAEAVQASLGLSDSKLSRLLMQLVSPTYDAYFAYVCETTGKKVHVPHAVKTGSHYSFRLAVMCKLFPAAVLAGKDMDVALSDIEDEEEIGANKVLRTKELTPTRAARVRKSMTRHSNTIVMRGEPYVVHRNRAYPIDALGELTPEQRYGVQNL